MKTEAITCIVTKENKRGEFKTGKPFVEYWLDEANTQYPNELIVTFAGDRIPTGVSVGDKVEVVCAVDGRTYNERRYVSLRGISCKVLVSAPSEDDYGVSVDEATAHLDDDPMPF